MPKVLKVLEIAASIFRDTKNTRKGAAYVAELSITDDDTETSHPPTSANKKRKLDTQSHQGRGKRVKRDHSFGAEMT